MPDSAPTTPNVALLQIGEVVDRTGLSLRTVRYYEEQDLVVPDSRTAGGYRLYTDEHVERLELIKQMKPLGFSIQEMREVLDARDAARDEGRAAAHAARDTLSNYAALADERLAKKQRQLAGAKGLPGYLHEQARRTPA